MTKVFISGCSFTQDYDWPQYLHENSSVTNLGRSGSSNRFICHSVASAVTKNDYDKIFVLFTGLSKLDVMIPSTPYTKKIAKKWKYYGEVDDMLYIFDGGNPSTLVGNYNQVKDENWPSIDTAEQFYELPVWIKNECLQHGVLKSLDAGDGESIIASALMLQQFGNRSHVCNTISLQSIAFLTAFLDKHKMNYWFAFALDPFTNPYHGKIYTKNIYYHKINWNRYIDLNPYEFCFKNGTLGPDQFHPTPEGMRVWAKTVKSIINQKTSQKL